jgi:uncharacterized protein (DUF4415 family)
MAITKMKLGEGKTKLTSAQIKNLKNIKDEDIDTSEIPEITKKWLSSVKIVRRFKKVPKTIRFDKDVIEFIQKEQGKGYQTFINEVLKEYAKQHGMKA